jgi:tryptophanyl-tRNA synthetase
MGNSAKRGTIFSAMRPTGLLHLGNLEGALRNWVRLQDEYVMYCGIVDLHALTTDYDKTGEMRHAIWNLAVDYMSAGIAPEKTTLVVQSQVKQHSELHLLLSMITPISWLERVPTYKEKLDDLHGAPPCYGLLGYPVLMAADILLYKADTVPVGQDQLPHLELTREIARRFNHLYGPVFPEPQALLTETPLLPGLDNRKMSKSYDNTLRIGASPDEIRSKVRMMFTDPRRIYRTDPGHPYECPVWMYHKVYTPEREAQIAHDCMAATLGCVDDKADLAESIIRALAPIREARARWEKEPGKVWDIINEGNRRASEVAERTMQEVRAAMKL